jgi:hypothetical protein
MRPRHLRVLTNVARVFPITSNGQPVHSDLDRLLPRRTLEYL